MQKWITKNGYEIHRVLKGRCNSFLVSSENLILLVDTGKASAYKKLMRNINSLNIPPYSNKILVLTHTHFDHCQNAAKLSTLHGFRIWVGKAESNFLKNGYTPIPQGTNLFTKILVAVAKRLLKAFLGYAQFDVDLEVTNNVLLTEYNVNIKIVATPGHSAGSVSIIVDDEIALVGDALFGIFPNSIYPPFADDKKEMIKSWDKLLQTNCTLFMPAHGKPVSRELMQKEFKQYSTKNDFQS